MSQENVEIVRRIYAQGMFEQGPVGSSTSPPPSIPDAIDPVFVAAAPRSRRR